MSLEVTYLDDSAPPPFNFGPIGVYARYAAFQRRVAQWTRERCDRWDVAHHISWGSVNHPTGLLGVDTPLVIGPAGGGQGIPEQLRPWVDGELGWNRLREAVLDHPRLNLWSRRLAARADLLLIANNESASLVRKWGAKRIHFMLPDGVRGELTVSTVRHGDPLIVWIGRFLPIKAAGLALAAFRHVLRVVPNARLVMIGAGPTQAAIQDRAKDLVCNGTVRFTGELQWVRAQALLSQATVHLFTSIRDSAGAQALEAAALGVPTVALDLGGLGTFCHQTTGFRLVAADSACLPTALARDITSICALSEEAWQFESRGAQEFAGSQTFANRARELVALYGSL